jgi:hypothetical protein
MGLSKERYEYHLTSRGWMDGSFYGDVKGGQKMRETPSDRVMTLVVSEVLDEGLRPNVYDQIAWQSDDQLEIKRLLAEFGDRPKDALPLIE